MNPFDDLRYLVAVVDAGTLSAAAAKNGISPAAISKRLNRLEARLGVRLLERNARRLRTTEAGAMYYRRGKQLIDAFVDLEEQVATTASELRGSIRINAPNSFSHTQLAPVLARFMQQYPQLQVILHLNDAFIDIAQSDYDLVIRIGQLRDSSVVAKRISSTSTICVASPRYLQQHGTPKHPEELVHHHCLLYEQQRLMDQWVFHQAGQTYPVQVRSRLHCNNGDFLYRSALQGLGIAMLPGFTLQCAIQAQQLQCLFCDFQTQDLNIYALYPSRLYLPEKVRCLLDFLQQHLPDTCRRGLFQSNDTATCQGAVDGEMPLESRS